MDVLKQIFQKVLEFIANTLKNINNGERKTDTSSLKANNDIKNSNIVQNTNGGSAALVQANTCNFYQMSESEKVFEYKPDVKAKILLKNAIECKENNNIFYLKDFEGTKIQCGTYIINSKNISPEEFAEWEEALMNLIKYGYIEREDKKGQLYKVLNKGYKFNKEYTDADIAK